MKIVIGNQPNIHPGSIPSTGRRSNNSGGSSNQQTATILSSQQYIQNGVIPGLSSPLGSNLGHMIGNLSNVSGIIPNQILMTGTPTSTQNVAQQQLIGGAISPSLITIQTQQQSQVSFDNSSSSSGKSSSSQATQNPTNPSNNSGELCKETQLGSNNTGAATFIDAPMLSAMQQMFSTMDYQTHLHHNPTPIHQQQSQPQEMQTNHPTVIYHPNTAAASIYFN